MKLFTSSARRTAVVLLGTSLLVTSVSAQTTLSGLILLSTDSSGATAGGNRWNTVGGDSIVSLYLTSGATLSGPFLNGPSDAQAGISIPLAPGSHTFTFYAMGGTEYPHHAINLFFNGSNTAPRISAVAPTQNSTSTTGFSANGSPNSQTLHGAPTAAANSLTFTDGGLQITLSDFFYAAPGVYPSDRVGFVPFSQSYVGSDGRPDWVGQFTLNVVPVNQCTNIVYVTNTVVVTNLVVVTNTVHVPTNISLMTLRRGIKAAHLQTPTARPLVAHIDQAQRALEQLGTRVEHSVQNPNVAEDLQGWIDALIGTPPQARNRK